MQVYMHTAVRGCTCTHWCTQVYTVESNVLCRRLINSYVTANNLESRVIVLDKCVAELTADDVQFNKVSDSFSISNISFHGCFHCVGSLINIICGCAAVSVYE